MDDGVDSPALPGTVVHAGRGATAVLRHGNEVVGNVLRTQESVKPVFVSAGHLITLEQATELTLRLSPRYRLPETTRAADHACRQALR